MARVEDEEIVANKLINEEYKIWKKNSVFLYDIMYSRALEWPTLTTQWLPDVSHIWPKDRLPPDRTHQSSQTANREPRRLQPHY
jgi:hypothetical protein